MAPAPAAVPHPVPLSLLEAHANFVQQVGVVKDCKVCNEDVGIANLHVLMPCGHACMCTECALKWAAEGGEEDENQEMKMYCPFDREEVTRHLGLDAWLAEKAVEAFNGLKF